MIRKPARGRYWFVAVCFTLLFSTVTSAQTSHQYAYLVVPRNSDPHVWALSPETPPASALLQTLQVPADRIAPSQAFISPNGDWVVFLLASSISTGDPLLIRLVNLASGETRDIGMGHPVRDSINALMSDQSIVWSPDGRYLALNLFPDNDEDQDLEVFVYSVSVNLLVNITNDKHHQTHVAWSPESARFVTRTDDCSQRSVNSYCSYTLDLFNVTDNSHLNSFQLPNPTLGSIVFAGTACELRWSPDGNSISYVSSCTDGAQIPRGVYVWSIAQNEATQVASFTPQATAQGIPDFQGWYAPFWYDRETLVVGADYRTPNLPEAVETMAYNVADGTSVALFPEMVTEWALNPVSNVIAARSVPPAPAVEDDTAPMDNSTLRLFTLDLTGGITLEDVGEAGSLPPGCHLAWSPDGATLAYVTTTSGDCADTIQSIVFVDGATGAVQEYVPELGEDVWYTIPIGWIRQ